jgi:uncharacterized repeat protein (TIGR03803 family)
MSTTFRSEYLAYFRRLSTLLVGGCRRGIGLFCLMLAGAMASPAQDAQISVKFKTLVNSDSQIVGFANSLVQDIDGNLYGFTLGGTNGGGTLFKMTPQGSLSLLYNFCSQPNCADGQIPDSLALGRDGNLYGTTLGGGRSVRPRHNRLNHDEGSADDALQLLWPTTPNCPATGTIHPGVNVAI